MVLDGSDDISGEDREIMDDIRGMNSLILINKTDLGSRIKASDIEDTYPADRIIETSLISGKGVEEVEDAIERMVFGGELVQKESLMVSNVRHIELLEKSRDSLRSAMKMTERKEALDFIEIDVRDAYERLGEITGDTVSEDIINEVFSRFCLGK